MSPFPSPFADVSRADLPREVLASVVVFLVALPLCMGIAVASGVPPALGLVTGIVGGLVVGSLAGSPLQVSGPAAGLAVLVYELVGEYGLAALGIAVLATGFIQMAAGRLHLGRWFRATSPAVIRGMLSGIGLLILGSQFHVMVDDAPRKGGLANLLSIPEAIAKGVTIHPETTHHLAAAIGVISLLSLIAWTALRPKKLAAVPGPLVAVFVGATGAAVFGLDVSYVVVPQSLASSFAFPTLETARLLADPGFLGAVIGMAAIASAETLLCATAVDAIHDGDRTDYDQELFAQGVGNAVCGVLGSLPLTGVIVRSSANVEAGAKTRLSAILHGVWLLALVVALPAVLRSIPTAALAAILVYIGWKLFNPRTIVQLWKLGKAEAGIYAVTLLGIVAVDLLTGVMVGLAASMLRLLFQLADLRVRTEFTSGEKRVDVHLEGAATFVSLPKLAETLEALEPGAEVHLHVDRLSIVDHAAMEVITAFERTHLQTGGSLYVEWDALHMRSSVRMEPTVDEVADGGQEPSAA